MDPFEKRAGWWWLSFMDPKKPAGSRFLGVIVIEAASFDMAIRTTHAMWINPGGEVRSHYLGSIKPTWPEEAFSRLLSADKLEELGIGERDPMVRWSARRSGPPP